MSRNRSGGLTHVGDLLADLLPADLPPDPVEPAPAVLPAKPSKRIERRLERVLAVRNDREQDSQRIGYLGRPFILCGLPFKKRSDTKVGTIEKRYGKDLGVRSDKKLGNYLKEKGYRSLSELLKNE